MTKKTLQLFHALSEDKYIDYMNEINTQKHIINNLLFDDPGMKNEESTIGFLCEQRSSIFHLEIILEELEDSFSTKKQEFYLSDEQALKFTILLSSLDAMKAQLLINGVSTSLH